jgi:predicted MFS family arabinose efflux permease
MADGTARLNPRIAALTLVTFSFGSAAFIFAGILETMAADLGVSTAVAGQLQTAYVLSAAFLGPLLAWPLGRLDRRLLVIAGLTGALLLNLACAASPSFTVLLPLRALAGVTGALAIPGATVSAAALAPPERRGSAMAMVSAGMTLAFVIGVPLGSVIGSAFGWRATFVFAAFLGGLALTGVVLFMPRVQAPVRPEGGRIRLRTIWPIYLTTYLMFAANMAVNLYIAPLVRVGAGVTGAGVGAFQLLIGLASIGGLWIGARAADRGGGKTWLIQGFAIQAVAMTLHLSAVHHLAPDGWPSILLVGTAIVVAATALFSMTPVTQSRLVTATHAAPVAMSVNSSVVALGQATGASTGGAALAAFGVPAIPLAALCISLIAVAALALAYPREALPDTRK